MAALSFKGRHFQKDMTLVWSNNSSSPAVSESLTLFNADELIEGTSERLFPHTHLTHQDTRFAKVSIWASS